MNVSDSVQVPASFSSVLKKASQSTGTDFDFLVYTAFRESRFKASAKSPTSSASGPFQFIEKTWFEVLKKQGPSLGYGDIAKNIHRQKDGSYDIPNASLRKQVLALRNDPSTSADMAAAYARMNADYLQKQLGRPVTSGEAYIAHFLGPAGAKSFIKAYEATPRQNAADHFPAAAKANRNIFYDKKTRAPLDLQQVYQKLTHGFNPFKSVTAKAFAAETETPIAKAETISPPALDKATFNKRSDGFLARETDRIFFSLFRQSSSYEPASGLLSYSGFTNSLYFTEDFINRNETRESEREKANAIPFTRPVASRTSDSQRVLAQKSLNATFSRLEQAEARLAESNQPFNLLSLLKIDAKI